jgi:uncharacterized protein (TIGR02646 family)
MHSAEYNDGTRLFHFDQSIYGDAKVKKALIDAQHGKCCFCERKIGSEGDVEHFRPKASFCQGEGMPPERPGYYWLAYEWDNLLLACPICNQRFKKSLFPLINPTKRAKSHKDDVTQEQPLFINPAEMDPAGYIGFRQEYAYPIDDNPRAEATIKDLGLTRENLNEERRDHLSQLVYLRKVLDQEEKLSGSGEGRHLLKEARAFLSSAVLDTAKFAAMARAAATVDFRLPLP